jgi:hypothetical protein
MLYKLPLTEKSIDLYETIDEVESKNTNEDITDIENRGIPV